jgi:hypothetical protein
MNKKEIESFVELHSPNSSVVIADGMDEAFIGLDLESDPPRAVYSVGKCIDILAQDMAQTEAEEFFWYNVAGSSGEGYPSYVHTPTGDASPYD